MSETTQPQQEVLIVTGMSGAGRSTAAKALEDLGWYVVDNLPPQMLRPLVDLAERADDRLPRIAAVVDVRGRDFFPDLQQMIGTLREGTQLRVVFLDASDAVLVTRFDAVRRPHPLQNGGTLLDGISTERARLSEIRDSSDVIIDTSELNIHQLATRVNELFREQDTPGVRVTMLSFGFKYGHPQDADTVADARFLPNPFWIPELRSFSGRDEQVREYVLGRPGAEEFIDAYSTALELTLDGYQRENKRNATFAIGCTGGKHRSVALVERIAARLSSLPGVAVTIRHRDLGRE
ncbi:RNase adapter RapZ [Mycetocola reblochoni]|uniref:Predicted P-loop-containing kinase n=2 Tax=Mycetocola reblochoni TaxID=331618 RepID=A0A1R4J4S6_9MICO|nr:RNase adapter RapZ [Mycetocola reblochoni]RLP69543.1 RNase adapter RapZ [Mycetocola reblochoni]SJN27047.1 Predicted P-loop-containing kinase [Mycetocola reblochoni REB411]